MGGILGKIFGSTKIVNAGIASIDALVFTPQEKSEAKLELLKHYEPFKIAQRYLAIMFAGQFLITFNVCLVLTLMGNHAMVTSVLSLVVAFSLGEIMLVIVGFYFLGGVVSGGFGKKK